MRENPLLAVPFVDNHDTQPGQSLESWVQDWFKPLAYALILLRGDGYPCVFYGDYYGIPTHSIMPKRQWLRPMIKARELLFYGKQHDYFDDPHLVGWTREGDEAQPGSGLAVVMSNEVGGSKTMYVGERLAGRAFYDVLGNRSGIVMAGADGNAVFSAGDGSVSVWAPVLR